VERGVAYQADDGSVYFAIDKFPSYGKLSRLDTREVKSGARVLQDDYSKENAQDFALWKAAKPEDEATGAAWNSPWGRGRPGWHLECSAMAMDLLGDTLDLHCGGIDLIFPHHEDEIAQSEAATGQTFSRVWCHGAFLLTEGAKMAKRVGNVSTVQGLREARFSAAALRHFVFNTHYRKELNLSEEALLASTEAVKRVGAFADRLRDPATLVLGGTPELTIAAGEAVSAAEAALFDDLNAPEALAALFDFIRQGNAELDKKGGDRAAVEQARTAFDRIDQVLDLVPERAEADAELVRWVEELLASRREARIRRDFAESDRIRDELKGRGVVLEDAGGETRWKLG
jgi:cysteinyl-tRNA synthetase